MSGKRDCTLKEAYPACSQYEKSNYKLYEKDGFI